jgi:hypothetical protein
VPTRAGRHQTEQGGGRGHPEDNQPQARRDHGVGPQERGGHYRGPTKRVGTTERPSKRLERGELEISVKDAIAAASLLERFAPQPEQAPEITEDFLMKIVDIVRDVVGWHSPEWKRFIWALKELGESSQSKS